MAAPQPDTDPDSLSGPEQPSGYFILLARHGPWPHQPLVKEDQQPLTSEGVTIVREIAASFAEQCTFAPPGERPRVGTIWCSTPLYARQTAEIYQLLLQSSVEAHCRGWLNPEKFWNKAPSERPKYLRCVARKLAQQLGKGSSPANAILVVGHEPMLGQLASLILGEDVPFARAELACIAIDREWPTELKRSNAHQPHRWSPAALVPSIHRRRTRLLWAIEPSDRQLGEQLTAKIMAKMDVAKVLGAILALVLGAALGPALDPTRQATLLGDVVSQLAFGAAFVCLFGSELLYLATIYAYDRLLMPVRFWSGTDPQATGIAPRWMVWRPAQRPPSSSNLVLFQNMLHVWAWMFTPATVTLVLGLFFLLYAGVHKNIPKLETVAGPFPVAGMFLVAGVVLGGACWGWYQLHKPKLGVPD